MLIKFLDGSEKEFASLRYANLRCANLRGSDLRCANLSGSDLRDSDLSGSNLSGSDLCGSDLRYADLGYANLGYANLCYANLCGSDLRYADLGYANLSGVSLRCANLSGSNLSGSDLSGSNLSGANIADCDTSTFCIVGEGSLIGYKKLADGSIAKLRIPAAAKRVNAIGSRKCRAEFAVTLEGSGVSTHNPDFKYILGKKVKPKEPFCDDIRVECASGIHFFLTRTEAEKY